MILWLATTIALAQDCPPLGDRLDAAWAAFNDAELAQAKAELQSANTELSCQTEVVNTEQLLGLFRLDALVSVTQEDQKGAVYATIRAVTIDPQAQPPQDLGPALQDLFSTWAGRLKESTVVVSVADGGQVWVDGRPVTYDQPLEVIEGEHLVQRVEPERVASEVTEITADLELTTGVQLPDDVAPPEPVGPVPEPELRTTSMRNRPAALWGTGLGTAALGGAAIGAAFAMEQRFANSAFDDDTYGDCTSGDDCYATERERVIKGQATQIRATYGAGYGLVGVGGVLAITGLVGLPVSTDGATVSVHLEW